MRLITLIRMAGLLVTAGSAHQPHPKIPTNVKPGENVVDYEGSKINGLLNGFGTVRYMNGRILQGRFLDSKPHGPCKLNSVKGTLLIQGECKNGALHGNGFLNGALHGNGFLKGDLGMTYEGTFVNGEMTHGQIVYEKNRTYLGDCVKFNPHGTGLMVNSNGYKYSGVFKNGDFLNGTLQTIDGDIFEGPFNKLQLHGEGKVSYSSGDSYRGWFKDGKFHGQGTFIFRSGTVMSGEFKSNVLNGFGKIQNINGRNYIGECRNAKPNGDGVMVDEFGTEFKGVFKDGSLTEGEIRYKDGRILKGKFNKNGKIHGKGMAHYPIPNNATYVGNFKNGKFNIKYKGRIVYPNGDIAIGLFNENTELHGPNGYQKKNNIIFEGPFHNGKLHGQGVVTDPDGTRYSGNFKEGLAHMLMNVTFPDRRQDQVLFFDGVPHTGIVNNIDLELNERYAFYLKGTKCFTFDESFLFMATIIMIAIIKRERIKCVLLEFKKKIDDIQKQKKIINAFNHRHKKWCVLSYIHHPKEPRCSLDVLGNCSVFGFLIPNNVLKEALSQGISINSSAPFPRVDQLKRMIIIEISSSESFKRWVLNQVFGDDSHHELFTVSIHGNGACLILASSVSNRNAGDIITIGKHPILKESLCSDKGLSIQPNMDIIFEQEAATQKNVLQKKLNKALMDISTLSLNDTLTPFHWDIATILRNHSRNYHAVLRKSSPFKSSQPTPSNRNLYDQWMTIQTKIQNHDIWDDQPFSLDKLQSFRKEITDILEKINAFMYLIQQVNNNQTTTETALNTFLEHAKALALKTSGINKPTFIANGLCKQKMSDIDESGQVDTTEGLDIASIDNIRTLTEFLSGNGISGNVDDYTTASSSMASIQRSMISMSADSHGGAIAKEIEAFVEHAIAGTLEDSDQVHLDMHLGHLLALTKDDAETCDIDSANARRQGLHLPNEQTYFYHCSHTNRHQQFALNRQQKTGETDPIRSGVHTMLDDGLNALINQLNKCNYDTSNIQLNEANRRQFIHRLTEFYVDGMKLKHTQGSHQTYIGPYIFPNENAWRFIGNRPDMIADAYIRLNLLIHHYLNGSGAKSAE